jgi:glycosyltransferase involved in cell wall biosynthesis
VKTQSSLTVGLLLSCDSFESYFGSVLKLDRDTYLDSYRNDFSWYYAKGLIENGIRPILYIPSLRYEGFYDTNAGVGVRFLRLAGWYRPLTVFRRASWATRWSLYLQEYVNAAAFLQPLREAVAADGIDLLYVQEYWTARLDYLAYRLPVPITAADHGAMAQGRVTWFKRKAFQRVAALYCQTRDEYSQARRYGGAATLQPNGGDTSFFFPPPAESVRGQNIVTVARLTDKQKRTSDLIRAMTLLPEEWSLDIIGTGPDREMLEALTKSLDVASRVRFHGFQGRSEVRLFLQGCGVYAMPSGNEGMCMAMLEAMSCGAAVVGSRIRAFEAPITDGVNGRLFPVGDVAALAAAIQSAWAERGTLGPAASASVAEEFNSIALYSQLAQSMRSIVGSRGLALSEMELTVGV